MKKLLAIQGHPSAGSYCDALLEGYLQGAQDAGHEVKSLYLRDLSFDPILRLGSATKAAQELEPDLVEAQQLITWAEHLLFVYPTWWGTTPALLKGFIDRTFLPGFAFKYRDQGGRWDKLLQGRSAQLIVTMDAPPLYNALYYLSAGHRAMREATLKFCGIQPVKVKTIGSVKTSDAAKRKRWVEEVTELGHSLS